MTSKDKLIGVALILIWIGFIALGLVFGMKPVATANNNQVYAEQQNTNTQMQNNETYEADDNSVNVYVEGGVSNVEEGNDSQDNTTDEDSTRYIY